MSETLTSRQLFENHRSLAEDYKKAAQRFHENESAENEQELDRLDAELTATERRMQVAKRCEGLDLADPAEDTGQKFRKAKLRDLSQPEIGLLQDRALKAIISIRTGRSINPEQEEACRMLECNPASGILDFPMEAEKRDLIKGTTTLGGFTVPTGFQAELIRHMLWVSPVREVARVWRTASGESIQWPLSDDLANVAAIFGEAAAITTADQTYSQLTFGAFKYATSVKYSAELANDSAFNMASEVARDLGVRMGQGQNAHFTTGAGTTEPWGYVQRAEDNANAIITSPIGAAGATAFAATLETFHGLDPVHRQSPALRWTMHDQILKLVRRAQDAAGQNIWQPSLAVGQPATLLGVPYFVNQNMASAEGASTTTMTFGDMSKYVIRDAGPTRLRVLNELYAENDLVGVQLIMRADANMLTQDTWTTPAIVCQQAS